MKSEGDLSTGKELLEEAILLQMLLTTKSFIFGAPSSSEVMLSSADLLGCYHFVTIEGCYLNGGPISH